VATPSFSLARRRIPTLLRPRTAALRQSIKNFDTGELFFDYHCAAPAC